IRRERAGGKAMATSLNIRWLRSFVGVFVCVVTMLVCAQGASGQVAYELLHAFAMDETFPFLCRETGFPLAGLVEATDGQLFGTTAGGGPCGVGTVFKITAAGTFTILHSFDC